MLKRTHVGGKVTPAEIYGYEKEEPVGCSPQDAAEESDGDEDEDESDEDTSSETRQARKVHKKHHARKRPSKRLFEDREEHFEPVDIFDSETYKAMPLNTRNLMMVAFVLGATKLRRTSSMINIKTEVGYMWFSDPVKPRGGCLSWDGKIYGSKAIGAIYAESNAYVYLEFIQKGGDGDERKTCIEVEMDKFKKVFETAYARSRGLPLPRKTKFMFEDRRCTFLSIDPATLELMQATLLEIIGCAINANLYHTTCIKSELTGVLWHDFQGTSERNPLKWTEGDRTITGDRATVCYTEYDQRVTITFHKVGLLGAESRTVVKTSPTPLVKRCLEVCKVAKTLDLEKTKSYATISK